MPALSAPNARHARPAFGFAMAALAAALFGSLVVSAYLGAAELSIGQVWTAIIERLTGRPSSNEIIRDIVWQIRMPRVIMAAVVGAALAVAGAAFQGLLRNPLADPYIVGVSSGAAVGGAIAVLLNLGAFAWGLGVPALAFLFAMLGMGLVYRLATRGGTVQVGAFLLAGVAVGSALWALITLFLIAARQDLASILYWLMGSFADRTWTHVQIAAGLAFVSSLALLWQARGLTVFALGEETATHLGVDTERMKRVVLVAGSIMTAAAVSFCGIIGFVGLIVPHIGRRLFGPDLRRLYPAAALIGALLTVWADVAARMLLRPTEIPVGVITALLGTPLFIALLRRT